MKVLSGLRVGFLCESPDNSSESGKESWGRKLGKLCDVLSSDSGVDILLTALWPRGIQRGMNEIVYPVAHMSIAAAEAARALRPRYHFAASIEDAPNFWLRSPYRNQSVSATSPSYTGSRKYFTTRFCALAPTFNKSKQRFVYAIKVTPIDKMTFEPEPSDTTESPYLLPQDEREQTFSRNINEEAAAMLSLSTSVITTTANNDDGSGSSSNPPPAKRQAFVSRNTLERPANSGCWFCLGNPNIESHLIAYMGQSNYVAIAKGGLCDGHAMVIPIEHAPSTINLPEIAKIEINSIINSLSNAYGDRPSVAFELRIVSRNSVHGNVQFCPLLSGTPREVIMRAFNNAVDRFGSRFYPMEEVEETADMWSQQNYIWYQLSDGSRYVATYLPQRIPFSLGRGVLAELLGRPEAVDWKSCVVPREVEESMTENLKSAIGRVIKSDN